MKMNDQRDLTTSNNNALEMDLKILKNQFSTEFQYWCLLFCVLGLST